MPDTAPKETYSRAEVRRLLSLSERQLRQWEHHNLIEKADSFSLPDLIALRTLSKLHADRIAPGRIRVAVAAVRRRLAHIADPLRELKVFADGRKIRVEVAGQQMEPVSGQLLFNFDARELKRLLSFPGKNRQETENRNRRQTAEQWFQHGLSLEKNGAMNEAREAYETAVKLDPESAGAWVNLGTIYFHERQFARAESNYRRALEADPSYALAHFNMGNLFDERGDYGRALDHYKRAVALNPQYADAHYNLALLFQGGGNVMEAVRHWQQYLRLDPSSSWAAIARRELEKLRRSAVVSSSRPRRSTGTEHLVE